MALENAASTGTDPKAAKAALTRALDELIAHFERESLALPPTDAAIKQWAHQSVQLAQQIRDVPWHGKSALLRRLQRFQLQLRQTRHARRRLIADRTLWEGVYTPNAGEAADALQFARHPLAHAIQGLVSASLPVAAALPADPVLDLPVDRVAEPPAAAVEPITPQARKPTWRKLSPTPRTATHSTRADPVMALEARLAIPDSLDRARTVAIDWLARKGIKVADGGQDGFELRSADGKNTAIAVAWAGVWALQVETADTSLPGRRWRVEMVLVQAQPTPGVAIRLTAISPADQPPPPVSVPGLVPDLIAEVGLLDVEANEQWFAAATVVDSIPALKAMLNSLESPRRRRPAVVLSTYYRDGRPVTFLDPAKLKRLRGLAKVYVISREMSWRLTDALSKRFAVAGASVRLFRPGFTAEDPPELHPVWDPATLKAEGLTLAQIEQYLLREAAYASLQARDHEDAVPPFDRIREHVLRQQIKEARAIAQAQASNAGMHSEEIVQALRKQLADEESLRQMFEGESHTLHQQLNQVKFERDTLRDERDQLKAQSFRLQSRISTLQQSNNVPAQAVPFPNSWDELESWCADYLGDAVVVTPKAIRAARDSEYEDISFAYEVLYFLASTYVPCRRGDLDNATLEAEKARLRITISEVGKGAEDRRFKDSYTTTYQNRRVLLDMHVKRGTDKNPKFHFRLYFHWHEDKRVIVGSFPSHLDNTLT